MAYYIDLFSPETYEAFSNSNKNISGFRPRQTNTASHINKGDRFICYMTKLSRWIGILEVESDYFIDDEPIFIYENDPFTIRFKVNTIIWLEKEKGIPIKDENVWNSLSFTKGRKPEDHSWNGKFRGSLSLLSEEDGKFLEKLIISQSQGGKVFPVDENEYKKLVIHKVRGLEKTVSVSIPEEETEEVQPEIQTHRESIQIQALLAEIGSKMGMKIWIPKNDRTSILSIWKNHDDLIDTLPLNYDESTIKTIEQIDVIWLKGRSIKRAFEIEHTTSIYSGILRMADLLALQPNMDIKLHIVAPSNRRDKVFQELHRPVFSLLEKGPLYENCTYLTYESIKELAQEKHLSHLTDAVIEEYEEYEEQ